MLPGALPCARRCAGFGRWSFLASGLLVGCLAKSNDVILLRPQLPALATDCPVSVLADMKAPFDVDDLVEITYTYTPGGHDTAMNALRERTCYYGGDTLYKIKEEERGSATTRITATIARRVKGAIKLPEPAAESR